MVDYLALAISHCLLALAAWRLVLNPWLDQDPPDSEQADEGSGRA